MNYVERLTALRNDRDIDQAEIAKLLCCQQSAVLKYETGKAKYKIDGLIQLCLFYGVSADYILGLPKGLEYPQR